MKYYEKAIENYAKKRKEFYERALKNDVALFNRSIETMTATGKCHLIECDDCPIRLAYDNGVKVRACGVSTPQEVREAIAMEYEENAGCAIEREM